MAGQLRQAEDLAGLVPELELLDRVAVLAEAHALWDHVEGQGVREHLAVRQRAGAVSGAEQLAVADQLGGLLGQLVHAPLPGAARRLERGRRDRGQPEQVPQHGQHRGDRQRGAVGVGDDPDRVVPHRLGVDVRVDQRNFRVHAPGAGVVDHDRAARGRDRGPLARDRSARREEGDRRAVEDLGLQRQDLDLGTADQQPPPDRPGRGDQAQLVDWQLAVGDDAAKVLADRAGRADDHRGRHGRTTGISAVPSPCS
jgi:hypothetical protein